MRITAKHASFIALASVACALTSNARAQQPSPNGPNFYSPEREAQYSAAEVTRLEATLPVVRSEALESYFGQLLGDQTIRIVVFRAPTGEIVSGPLAMPLGGFANATREPVAVGNGAIFVNDRVLAESTDEAAFAQKIAHAIAHASLRHATKLATKMEIAGYAQLPMMFMGNGWAAYGLRQASQVQIPLGMLSFAKRYESEADQAAPGILTTLHLHDAAFAAAQAAVR